MLSANWRDQIARRESWKHDFGPPESPVVVAAIDPRTMEICAALRDIVAGRPVRLFIVGPSGSGKSAFLAALLAEAQEQGVPVRTVASEAEARELPQDLVQGRVGLLAVGQLDKLSTGIRAAVIEHRGRAHGLFAAANQLSAVTAASLEGDANDVLIEIPPLDERGADALVIAELLWPGVCGEESDLLNNCSDDAAENLCRGPYPEGVTSLRAALEQLADALIASGVLVGGEFRRNIQAQDISHAVLATIRAQYPVPSSTAVPAIVVVEGSTDVRYLAQAALLAETEWGWRLLEGCELQPSGEGRTGGARAVWRRLIELVAGSVDCLGLFDNDNVGRKEAAVGKEQSLLVELLPPEFDRLGLPPDQRTLEVEDLLSLDLLDRFYDLHPDLEPEEIRWRSGGAWRIVPRGVDKERLVDWAMQEMRLKDCLRLLYVLCVIRSRLGLPIPREDLGPWRAELVADVSCTPAKVVRRVSGSQVRNGSHQNGESGMDLPGADVVSAVSSNAGVGEALAAIAATTKRLVYALSKQVRRHLIQR